MAWTSLAGARPRSSQTTSRSRKTPSRASNASSRGRTTFSAGPGGAALCASRGYKVWAVVVNTDGVRIAVLRGDGAPIHSQDNAYYKAYTAASLTLGRNENSTKEMYDRMAKAAPTTVPATPLPNVTFAQGAIVIRNADKQIIGSIGVSGAPGGNLDEDCARESLAKIQTRIK